MNEMKTSQSLTAVDVLVRINANHNKSELSRSKIFSKYSKSDKIFLAITTKVIKDF